MKTALSMFLIVALMACAKAPPEGGNGSAEVAVANSSGTAPPTAAACVAPKLDLSGAELDPGQAKALTDNFNAAFAKACDEHLPAMEKLVDPRSADTATLMVINAPEANIASIYFNGDRKPPATVLEAPFGDQSQSVIPSAADLHEAIYCAVHGATSKEEEESGRCLPD